MNAVAAFLSAQWDMLCAVFVHLGAAALGLALLWAAIYAVQFVRGLMKL